MKFVRLKTRIPANEAKKLLKDLPGILSGRKPDRHRLFKIFWGAVAYSMFQSISEAYEQKSLGQSDELGNTWPDLSQKYKAYKRSPSEGSVPTNLRRRLKPSNNRLGLLTPTQHKRWQKFFGILYHSYRHKMEDSSAKELAAQIAWTRLKEEGAQTKLDVLGNRQLRIMRVSDKLYLSLSPGKFNPGSGYTKKNSNQVFQLMKGWIKIGTKLPYAEFHDDSRPVWPEDVEKWMDDALEYGTNAVYARLLTVFKQPPVL